ncbi:MAG: 50S ribosomal protein L19 [Mycoplasma sp.]
MNLNRQKILSDIQSSQLKTDVPNFSSGDTLVVHTKITENNKSRIQKFEGVVLRRRGSGLGETFTIRKESNGVWVEEMFQIHSPLITEIELKRKGKVRRAYISYMRKRSGKSARIKQG